MVGRTREGGGDSMKRFGRVELVWTLQREDEVGSRKHITNSKKLT